MKSQMASKQTESLTMDLAKIKTAISELTNVVNEIKTQLDVVNKNTNQLELNLPNVTTTLDYHEEEQWKKKRIRYKVLNTVTTVNGTLYAKEAVFVENVEENGDWRVKDTMGRIWFIKKENLK